MIAQQKAGSLIGEPVLVFLEIGESVWYTFLNTFQHNEVSYENRETNEIFFFRHW